MVLARKQTEAMEPSAIQATGIQTIGGGIHPKFLERQGACSRASGSLLNMNEPTQMLNLESEIDLDRDHNRRVLHSSSDMSWPTPQYVFDALNLEFGFTLDPCCVPLTAKCRKFYTPTEDGLKQDWSNERVFMNPPYGSELPRWIKKAFEESKRGSLVVCLVPARVDVNWWHDYATRGEVRFLKGRIKGSNGQSWPFAAAVIVFRPFAYRVEYHDLLKTI